MANSRVIRSRRGLYRAVTNLFTKTRFSAILVLTPDMVPVAHAFVSAGIEPFAGMVAEVHRKSRAFGHQVCIAYRSEGCNHWPPPSPHQ